MGKRGVLPQTRLMDLKSYVFPFSLSNTVPTFFFQSHGVMERDILCTYTILGKFFWKYIHAGSFSTFDVYLTSLVSLDHRFHCGHLAHAPSGKFQFDESSSGHLFVIRQFNLLTYTFNICFLSMLLLKWALIHLLAVET